MCKHLLVGAALLLIGAPVATAKADQPATINPSVNVTPVQAGTVITPSVNTTVPLGGGATLQGGVQVPIVVPQGGSPVVTPPNVNIGVSIPLP